MITSPVSVFRNPPNIVYGNRLQQGPIELDSRVERRRGSVAGLTHEVMVQALSQGSFIAAGQFGPQFYAEQPLEAGRPIQGFPNISVYGWSPNAQRNDLSGPKDVIVCGYQQGVSPSGQSIEHVYYVVPDKELRLTNKVTRYELGRAPRVYATSLSGFSKRFHFSFPIVSENEGEKARESLSRQRQDLTAMLASERSDSFNARMAKMFMVMGDAMARGQTEFPEECLDPFKAKKEKK